MHFILRKLLLLCLSGAFVPILAQEAVSTAGGENSQMSWTIGETVTGEVGSNTILTQGVQQPVIIVTAIESLKEIDFELNAFPNPTSDFVRLTIQGNKPEKLLYSLFGLEGKLLNQGYIIGESAEIPFRQLSNGTYLLKITSGSRDLKTFKIVKK